MKNHGSRRIAGGGAVFLALLAWGAVSVYAGTRARFDADDVA